MIYNKKLNTIIWLPYKNFSSSLVHYFDAHEWNTSHEPTDWELYLSNSIKTSHVPGWNGVDCSRHGITYPIIDTEEIGNCFEASYGFKPFHEYRRLLPIRNPYDRVLSMWKFHIESNRYHKWGAPETLKWFMEEWFMFHPLSLPVCRIFKTHWQFLIKTEDIENELKKHEIYLPYKKFPKANKSNLLLEDLMDEATTEVWENKYKPLIAHFHKVDFEAGNYAM